MESWTNSLEFFFIFLNAMAVRKVFFYLGPFESVSSLFAEVQYCFVHAPSIEDDLRAPLTHFHITDSYIFLLLYLCDQIFSKQSNFVKREGLHSCSHEIMQK